MLGLSPAEEHLGRPWGSVAGGEEDSVRAFEAEAWRASHTLCLYEAATRPTGPDMEMIKKLAPPRYRDFRLSTPAMARRWALLQVQAEVQYKVALYCYPTLYPQNGDNFAQGWGFSCLLGAMWLQMFVVLTVRDVPVRCKLWELGECENIISFGQRQIVDVKPQGSDHGMKKYATREDKEFCSDSHRYRYNYLTVRKPQRQAKRDR